MKPEPVRRTNGNVLDVVERIAKIFSLLAIPVIIAVGGWMIQRSANTQSVKQEYVKIAIALLKEQPSDQSQPLRAWAAKTLSKYSEVPINEWQFHALETGEVVLPAPTISYDYDSLGRIKQITGPDGYVIIYRYDKFGNLQLDVPRTQNDKR